jgi:hypothetical protein
LFFLFTFKVKIFSSEIAIQKKKTDKKKQQRETKQEKEECKLPPVCSCVRRIA